MSNPQTTRSLFQRDSRRQRSVSKGKREAPHLCSEESGPVWLYSQFLFQFYFEEELETKTNQGSLEKETDEAALTQRGAPLLISFGPSGLKAPRAPTYLAPHPSPVSWCSPGRSTRVTPLRPSWPRLLSPHEWTVPSLSSSSEWRSPLAAC